MRDAWLLLAVAFVAHQAYATNYGFHQRNAEPTVHRFPRNASAFRGIDPTLLQGSSIHSAVVGQAAIVVTGGDNLLMVSNDGGLSWVQHSNLQYTPYHGGGITMTDIVYSPVLDMYLICGFGDNPGLDNFMIYSLGNASIWKEVPNPPICSKMHWANGVFAMPGDSHTWTSTNGLDWEEWNVTLPEECFLTNTSTCGRVSPHYYSTYYKAWIALFEYDRNQTLVGATKDAYTWTALDIFPGTVYGTGYFYDTKNVLTWSVYWNETIYMPTLNIVTKNFLPNVTVPSVPNYSVLQTSDMNNTLFWVFQAEIYNPSTGGYTYNIEICTSVDGYTWLVNGSFQARNQWHSMIFLPANQSWLAVGDEGLLSLGGNYSGQYYFNSINTVRLWADFRQIIWIDSLAEYVAGPTLMISKTAHKWDLLSSEIDVPLDDWKYIPQSPYAQFFGIGNEDHYILVSQNPKRWSAFYVPEIRSHKPVMTTICSNGGPAPTSVLVMGYYTHHEDAMSVRSEDGGQTWTNIYYFQAGAPIRHCTYGNGVYVGLTHHPHIYNSVNGSIWHKVGGLDKETEYQSLEFFNNHFIAVGNNCTITTSTDGVNWVNQTIPGCYSALNGVSWTQTSGWMVVGEDGTFYTSPDLTNWTLVPTSVFGSLRSVAYSEALDNWVIVGPNALIMSQIIEN